MEFFEALMGVAHSLWDELYERMGGVAEVATLITAVIVLIIAVAVFNGTKSFVLDVIATAVIAASTHIGLNAIFVVRDMSNGQLITTIIAIGVAVIYLGQSFKDGNTKLKVIDIVLILILLVAGGFELSSLSPDSRFGQLAEAHLTGMGDFWSGVFKDAETQLDS